MNLFVTYSLLLFAYILSYASYLFCLTYFRFAVVAQLFESSELPLLMGMDSDRHSIVRQKF